MEKQPTFFSLRTLLKKLLNATTSVVTLEKQLRHYGPEIFTISSSFISMSNIFTGTSFDIEADYIVRNHNDSEPDSCRKYGRLCNLLLKQGRISPNLRAMTIELLGSHEKKEQFFKEFEMNTHLAEFYERQGRSAELFQLLIEDGQLRPALDAASKSYAGSHEQEIETAFNLLHVQKLFWEQPTELDPLLLPSDWKNILPHSLISASADWNAVSRILNPVKKGQMSVTLADVQNEVIKECLCLHVS